MTTRQRTIRWRTSAWAGLVTLAVVLLANGARANERALEQVPDKLDVKLYEQSEADICAWLDARIEAAGRGKTSTSASTFLTGRRTCTAARAGWSGCRWTTGIS